MRRKFAYFFHFEHFASKMKLWIDWTRRFSCKSLVDPLWSVFIFFMFRRQIILNVILWTWNGPLTLRFSPITPFLFASPSVRICPPLAPPLHWLLHNFDGLNWNDATGYHLFFSSFFLPPPPSLPTFAHLSAWLLLKVMTSDLPALLSLRPSDGDSKT